MEDTQVTALEAAIQKVIRDLPPGCNGQEWWSLTTSGQDKLIGALLHDEDCHDYLWTKNNKGELESPLNGVLVGMLQSEWSPTEDMFVVLGKLIYQQCRKNLYPQTKEAFEKEVDDRRPNHETT